MNRLAQSVAAYIRKHHLLRPGDRVGVAVSGGADSVALLRLMLELRDELGVVLSVVHLNHKLRGADSDADEQFVRELAEAHGLEFISENCDVKTYSAEKKLSLEAAARVVRYEFFRRTLQASVNRIATGHTLDDQAETVLLRFMRGSGFRGLGGIRRRLRVIDAGEEVCGEIVRPLLGTRRDAVKNYLAEARQNWREDSTNNELKYTRNRVRQSLLPLLEKEFNPAITEKLAEFADIAQGEEEFWLGECNRLFGQTVRVTIPEWANFYIGVGNSPNSQTPPDPKLLKKFRQPGPTPVNIELDLIRFNELGVGVRRRLIQSLEMFGMPLEFKHINEILRLANGAPGEEIHLPWGWKVTRTPYTLQFLTPDLRVEERIPSNYEYELNVPGAVTVWEVGVSIEAVILSVAEDGYRPETLLHSRFAQQKWVVRNWRAGERFWPAHTKAPKKIKELLQDRHVTGEEKQRWPVIACGGEIIWLRGFGVRREFQANGDEGVLIRELDERQK